MAADHQPEGFAYAARSNGSVALTHHGRPAGTLAGRAAAEFLARIARCADPRCEQHLMARATGNYKRGNERRA